MSHRHWHNELGPLPDALEDSPPPSSSAHEPGFPWVPPALLFGTLLLFTAICLYVSGMWLPAGVCSVVGAAWMATLLDETERKDEA